MLEYWVSPFGFTTRLVPAETMRLSVRWKIQPCPASSCELQSTKHHSSIPWILDLGIPMKSFINRGVWLCVFIYAYNCIYIYIYMLCNHIYIYNMVVIYIYIYNISICVVLSIAIWIYHAINHRIHLVICTIVAAEAQATENQQTCAYDGEHWCF